MEDLEQYFEGEESWATFSKMFEDDWTNSDIQQHLLKLCKNQIDLAKVINYHLGKQSVI
ncbi:hypothetical protein ABW636_16860 [Aquimarina sp. 2201CG1-2-11]|uniref:hypothetical protein n=1 Tax=Aquimarina discodermiae TaxID=3231043 RepID=UPI003461C340